MSVKLNNNPTCVLTDADIYSESQKAKMAKNLMTGIPATSGEGDKVLVLDENGDPQLKDYSAGGSGSETPCIVDWDTQNASQIITAVQTALSANQPVFAKYTPQFASYPLYLPLESYGLQEGVFPTMTFIGFHYVTSQNVRGYKLEISSYGTTKYVNVFGGFFVPDTTGKAIGSTLQIVQGEFGGEVSWVAP